MQFCGGYHRRLGGRSAIRNGTTKLPMMLTDVIGRDREKRTDMGTVGLYEKHAASTYQRR
jgi:hypothetical protein